MNVMVDQNQTVCQELSVVTKTDGKTLKSKTSVAYMKRSF